MPNIASVDARVDPSNDQGKLGTTFKQAIPFGGRFCGDAAEHVFGHGNLRQPSDGAVRYAADGVPPVTGPPDAAGCGATKKRSNSMSCRPARRFGAGVTTASNDPVTHNTFSAEQKLYGPLHVTTAVTDFGQTDRKQEHHRRLQAELVDRRRAAVAKVVHNW